LLQVRAETLLPIPTDAIHNSSSAVVVSVVPLDREVTVLPVLSVLEVLSSTALDSPDHSVIDKFVEVELVQFRVTFPSLAPAILYQIPQLLVAVFKHEIASVHPDIDALLIALVPCPMAINKFPAVGVVPHALVTEASVSPTANGP